VLSYIYVLCTYLSNIFLNIVKVPPLLEGRARSGGARDTPIVPNGGGGKGEETYRGRGS
jgi:hypothetical protein